MNNTEIKALLKRVVEIVMPDLRSYYRVVRKAKIVKTYPSDGRYWADVQPLRNDESVDEKEPVIPRVEIPVVWAGPNRGVVCPPEVGTFCDLEYYDGDPDYPRISNFRWHGMAAPEVEIGGLIIQRESGTHIKIDAANNIIHVTPANRANTVGGNKTEAVGKNWTMAVSGDATVTASGTAIIQAPQINLIGNQSSTGKGGGMGVSTEKSKKTHDGSLTLNGPLTVNGSITASGSIMDGGGNSNHHSH
jgi:phage baseplate assembly protein gpV